MVRIFGTATADFLERIAEVDAALHEAQEITPKTEFENLDVDVGLASARWFGIQLVHVWNKLPETARSRFEQLLFPAGIVFDRKHGFRTTKLGLIFELYRSMPNPYSLKVHLDGFNSNQLGTYLKDIILLREEVLSFTEQAQVSRAA